MDDAGLETYLRSVRTGSRLPRERLAAPGSVGVTAEQLRWHRARHTHLDARLHIRWDASTIDLVPAEKPQVDANAARLELARRFLTWLGPASSPQFAKWAGVSRADAEMTWDALGDELVPASLDGDLVAAWARVQATVTLAPWRALRRSAVARIDAEAASMAAPLGRDVEIRWLSP